MLEEILNKENMTLALKRVISNKGACGVDGMNVEELRPYINLHWAFIRVELLDGSYKPSPVKKVEIPKPDGGKRMLGIPTVLDRLIQQGIAQKLSELFDKDFSNSSFGFRPNRSAHQAVFQAREYINQGYRKVIELDLEKFFDNVNHDRLMRILARRIEDKRVLKLIRKYLSCGIMFNGIISSRDSGTPQGSPLSPILSNIVLDELDKELERRELKFIRYADDISIYVKSYDAANRVKERITKFIEKTLKLKINQEKSKISRADDSNLLGFSFYYDKNGCQIRVSERSKQRMKKEIKRLTSRRWSISLEDRLTSLNQKLRGWVNYFRIAKCQNFLKNIEEWTRFRLRMCVYKTWKRVRTRIKNFLGLGLCKDKAIAYANTRKSYCRTAHSFILTTTLNNQYFKDKGFINLVSEYLKWQS